MPNPSLSCSSEQVGAFTEEEISGIDIFFGYARSGTSIIGSLMDAHPNMIIGFIAHEYKYIHDLQNLAIG